MLVNLIFLLQAALVASYRLPTRISSKNSLKLNAASQVIAATPTIEEWLDVCEPGLKKSMLGMFRACKEIAYKIRTASCDKMACFNEFGDEQLAIDILANNVIFQNLKASGAVATASSEETPTEGQCSINYNLRYLNNLRLFIRSYGWHWLLRCFRSSRRIIRYRHQLRCRHYMGNLAW